MHILIDYRPALRQRTGVGEYVHHLTSALLRRLGTDDRVTLFSSSWKDRLDHSVLPEAGRIDVRLPVKVLNLAWHRFEWPPVEVFGTRPDVTWSLHPLMIPSRAAARVITIHDLYFLDHPEATRREIRRDYPALAAQHARRADAIIVNSEYTGKAVADRLNVPAGKVTVCHPGAPRWPPTGDPPPRGPILHVGTIEPRKNIRVLIDAYRSLTASHPGVPPLVFAGRVESAMGGVVPDTAQVHENIRFLGYVSTDEKLRLYRDASMLVVSSSEEGFGIPALEAMSVGLPVVAFRHGSLPEVLGDAGLFVDGEGPVALAAAMARVLDDRPLREELGRRGPQRARRFDWDDSAAHLLEAFRCVHSRRRGAS